MKNTSKTRLIAAAALVGLLGAPAMAAAQKSPEERLAEKLEGRVAGEPVKCIDLNRIQSSTIYDGTAIVYDAGRTLYVNRPDNGANSLRKYDVMVTKTNLNRLCSVDTVQMHDTSGFWSGSVFLGEFVPYTKPKA